LEQAVGTSVVLVLSVYSKHVCNLLIIGGNMILKSDVIKIKDVPHVEVTSTFTFSEIDMLGHDFIRKYGKIVDIPSDQFPKLIGHMLIKASDLSDDIINIQGLGDNDI
jgi:hypothetical protein